MGRSSRVYLPVSQPPPSGDQGSSPSPLASGRGHDFPLDLAGEQVVLRLQRDQGREARALRDVDRALGLPAGEVRQSGVVDLAGAHGVVEEAQGLVERRERVVGVHLVEVDALDAEAAQRRVERRGQVLA